MFRPFKAAVLRAGLPKKLRLHDLRHSFADLFLRVCDPTQLLDVLLAIEIDVEGHVSL